MSGNSAVLALDGLDAVRAAVGTHLGHSPWHVVDQAQIDAFADLTHDHQWIHTDPERAASGPFGATVVHGYFTLALIPMLAWQVYDVTGLRMAVNYGLNSVRFPAPVPAGSRLRAGVELLELREVPAGAHLVSRVTIEVDGLDKPACVAETVALLVP